MTRDDVDSVRFAMDLTRFTHTLHRLLSQQS